MTNSWNRRYATAAYLLRYRAESTACACGQLAFATARPRDPALLPTLAELRNELTGLELLQAAEVERIVKEGQGHDGPSAVVQILGRKPA